MSAEKAGVLFALAAYGSWGLFPAFWKLLKHVPPQEILAHRIVWSALMFILLLAFTRPRAFIGALSSARAHWKGLLASACLIGCNWFVYIYAVNSGQILESSLGYFINPLVNVLLGVLFLGERLRPLQKASVILAAVGVLQLALQGPAVPWIALFLAFSFGFYGLIRKKLALDPLVASSFESSILALPAFLFLALPSFWEPVSNWSGGASHSLSTTSLLIVGGVVTGLPLLWFAAAGKRLPLSTLGFFQYIAPLLQFSLAVFFYGEKFTALHLRAFGCIWAALAIYVFDMGRKRFQARKAAALRIRIEPDVVRAI